MNIYFDNASTTPLLKEVKQEMIQVINDCFGNPSSIHFHGRKSKTILEEARKVIATGINASTGEIFFTSGATEANNMSILCSIRDLGIQRVISSPTEHHCIIHTLDYIEENSLAEVQYLDVDNLGNIDLEQLRSFAADSSKKTLISLMHANNEIGTLHDIDGIGKIASDNACLFHCDTAQSMGKFPLDVQATGVSFLSGSAHKFFGPKGVGFVYIRNENMIKPIFLGGGQERGLRSGTENIYGIVGMAKAFELAMKEMSERHEYVSSLRSYFKERLVAELEDIRINGNADSQLYNVLSVSFPPHERAALLMMNLDIAGISASAGSACSSGVESDSHVLSAINHDPKRKTVRFSLSHFNTRSEVDYVIEKLRKLSPSIYDGVS